MKLNVMILLILSQTALQASDPLQRMIAEQAERERQRATEIEAQRRAQAQREQEARNRALHDFLKRK